MQSYLLGYSMWDVSIDRRCLFFLIAIFFSVSGTYSFSSLVAGSGISSLACMAIKLKSCLIFTARLQREKVDILRGWSDLLFWFVSIVTLYQLGVYTKLFKLCLNRILKWGGTKARVDWYWWISWRSLKEAVAILDSKRCSEEVRRYSLTSDYIKPSTNQLYSFLLTVELKSWTFVEIMISRFLEI